MARGTLTGLVWGLVFGTLGAGVVSLMAPLPSSPDAATTAPGAGEQAAATGEGGTAPASGKDADLVEIAPTAPSGDATTGDDLSALEGADTQPAALPDVGGATGGLSDPGAAGTVPDVTADPDAPQPPATPGAAPAAPAGETELSISTDPSQPATPDVSDAPSGFGPTKPETEAAPQVSATTDTAPDARPVTTVVGEPAAVANPDLSTAPAAAPDTGQNIPDQPDAEDQSAAAAPQTAPEEPVAAPADPGQAPAQPAPAPAQPATPQADETPPPRVAALPQTGAEAEADSGPSIGTRVTPLTERGNGGNTLASADPGAPTADAAPPLEQFAAPFENPEGKPLMAIVLIDDKGAFGAEALQEFPYPLSFAINPSDPDAGAKMARYRAAGAEVVMIADLPSAATAQDAEVALAASFDLLPETVAVLEGVGSGVQGNRDLSDQVTAIAQGTGRGLILQGNGLNTAQKLAVRAGVPAALVFRDFDGAGQNTAVIRRFLDQAAFRAGQEGAVIMLGRVRPDTMSALLLWGLQDRASRVALAPVSAVLRATVSE